MQPSFAKQMVGLVRQEILSCGKSYPNLFEGRSLKYATHIEGRGGWQHCSNG